MRPAGHTQQRAGGELRVALAALRLAQDEPGAAISAAGRALEYALDLAQRDGAVLAFILHPAPEIADQLSVSANTVRTHMRHVYEKLGAHRRAGAVDRARALGLLAPSPHRA
jgi:ATP/maltotriose-dependent transcriptional regulator MalT